MVRTTSRNVQASGASCEKECMTPPSNARDASRKKGWDSLPDFAIRMLAISWAVAPSRMSLFIAHGEDRESKGFMTYTGGRCAWFLNTPARNEQVSRFAS